MKKFLCIILAVLSLSLVAFASDISVKLDGKVLEFEQPPVIIEERTLVPLRAIFEALGATVEWDGTNKIVTSTKGETTIKMGIGDKYFMKNDSIISLDVPAQIVGDGYTMVPARAVAESFGVEVDWDDSTKTVLLKSPKPTVEGAILYMMDAENPDDFGGLYSASAKPLHTVKDPINPDNNVFFLDSTVNDRASWNYIWIKTQFIPGCKYLIEYDVMLANDVFDKPVEKGGIGTCFAYALGGTTAVKQNGIGSTTLNAGVWQKVSQTYVVPEDYNTSIGCQFGIFASPISREGIDHLVAFDFYVDNITVAPLDNMPVEKTELSQAENIYFEGSTTKNPLEYKPGETMTFKLQVKSGRNIVKVPYIYYYCTGDDGKLSTGYVKASEDGFFYFDTKCEKDGFVRVIAKICDENKRHLSNFAIFEGGAGADIDKIKCDTQEPDDYLEFWDGVKKTAFSLDNEIIYEKELTAQPGYVAKDIRLKTADGAGEYASFIITYPENAEKGSSKLRMIFMGYGVGKANPQYKAGYITISMNSHDIPNDLTSAEYDNIKSTVLKSYGFIDSENQKPETSYWWKMYVRNMQVYNYATQLDIFDGEYVEFTGGSQGGFQACHMAAHTDLAKYCYMNVPWFGNLFANKVSNRQNGWYPAPMDGLRYFDTAIAAKYVKCKTEISAGLGDYTCPPSAIMAIYNNLSCEKNLLFIQNRTHSYTAPSYSQYTLSDK